jgi:hypothetical protein
LKRLYVLFAAVVAGCAGGPQIGYESATDATQQANAVDSDEARALERAETDCARQGKHAVSQRVEGETIYACADTD